MFMNRDSSERPPTLIGAALPITLSHKLGPLTGHSRGIVAGSMSSNMHYMDGYIDGLVQERRNSIANTMECRVSCTNPSIYENVYFLITVCGKEKYDY